MKCDFCGREAGQDALHVPRFRPRTTVVARAGDELGVHAEFAEAVDHYCSEACMCAADQVERGPNAT